VKNWELGVLFKSNVASGKTGCGLDLGAIPLPYAKQNILPQDPCKMSLKRFDKTEEESLVYQCIALFRGALTVDLFATCHLPSPLPANASFEDDVISRCCKIATLPNPCVFYCWVQVKTRKIVWIGKMCSLAE
jgi:hypothetical protein